MAPKIPPQSRQPSKEKDEKEQPSSEEEEDDDDDEVEESEADSSEEEKEGSSEDEQENRKFDKSLIPAPKFESKSTVQENWSDSEPESEVNASDYKIQPVLKSHAPPSKRAHQENDSSRIGKKPKTEEKKSGSASASGCITRLWSNEDEIAVLNGMVDFKNAKGVDPNADMVDFHNYVKGKLHIDFSRVQLKTKISRMKKRFLNALKKGENGEDPVFSNPHEFMAFEISKKIWGGAVGNSEGSSKSVASNLTHENAMREIVKAEKIEKEIVNKEKGGEELDFWSNYPFLSSSFRNVAGNFPSLVTSDAGLSFLKEKLSLIGNVKAKELDDKWKKLLVEETELNHKMLTLMTEQIKMAFSK